MHIRNIVSAQLGQFTKGLKNLCKHFFEYSLLLSNMYKENACLLRLANRVQINNNYTRIMAGNDHVIFVCFFFAYSIDLCLSQVCIN